MTGVKAPDREEDPAIIPGIYRHYKGRNYQVFALATHSETLETMVVYRTLYGERGLWVRPAAMFSQMVDTPQGPVRRFTYIGEKE